MKAYFHIASFLAILIFNQLNAEESGAPPPSKEVATPSPTPTPTPKLVQTFLASGELAQCIVGQKVSIIVEVFSPNYFTGSTRFTLPDIAGAVFYKPEDRAVVRSQTVDGATYSVQRHEISFYAQRPGVFNIPPFRVRYGTMDSASNKKTQHSELTEPIRIQAGMPKGAEHLRSLISATELKVKETWTPANQATFTAGNALQRKITFQAPDIPGMVFPALSIPETDGIRIYRERAQINDRINRGSLTGERMEKISYVFQHPGDYVLPEIQITWWDLQHKQLQVITLPAQSFEVLPAPVQNNGGAASSSSQHPLSSWLSWKGAAGGVLIILCLGGGVYWFRSRIMDVFTTWQHHHRESESAYFHKITADLSPSATHHAIIQWLAHTQPNGDNHPSLSDWARGQNNDNLLAHAKALQHAVVDPHSSRDWDAQALIKALKVARTKQLKKRSAHHSALKPLNPDHS